MRVKRKLWAVTLVTLAVSLIVVNVIYALVNAPSLKAMYFPPEHRDWFVEPDCEDISPHCTEWVENGGCDWSWLCQAQCQASCDRCHNQAASLHRPQAVAGIYGFQQSAEIMHAKVAAAMQSSELMQAFRQIERSNYARAAHAPIDLVSCRQSNGEHYPADLSRYERLAVDANHAGSLNEACVFHLTRLKLEDECEDKANCTGAPQSCIGSEFRQYFHSCPKLCAQCGMCMDRHDTCEAWSEAGQCLSNPGFMLEQCPQSCIKDCSNMYDPHPPYFVSLWNGLLMPTTGFGTAGLSTGTSEAVLAALDLGYRHIDTAAAREWYREDLVGKALTLTSVPRDEIFVTTKVHPKHLGYQSTLNAFATSLRDLNTTYVDLLLLHYSHCFGVICDKRPEGTWKDSWRALETLVREGKVLAIGVSNFRLEELAELVEIASIPPAVLQGHSDPFVQNLAIRRVSSSLGIQYAAYSSLGTQHLHQTGGSNPVLENGAINMISTSLASSTAQVVLKFTLGSGQIILPRSQNPVHMNETLGLHSLQLEPEDIMLLHSLNGISVSIKLVVHGKFLSGNMVQKEKRVAFACALHESARR